MTTTRTSGSPGAPRDRRHVYGVTLAAAALAALTGCGAGPAAAPPPVQAPPPAVGGGSTAAAPPAGLTNLAPVGEKTTVGSWEVTVHKTELNATELVLAQNEFNDAPVAGRQFVMSEVTLTYVGTDKAVPLSLSIDMAGASGKTYSLSAPESTCGVIPNKLDIIRELRPGSSVRGNICASVPVEEIEGGGWMARDVLSVRDNSTVWLALR